MNLQRKWN